MSRGIEGNVESLKDSSIKQPESFIGKLEESTTVEKPDSFKEKEVTSNSVDNVESNQVKSVDGKFEEAELKRQLEKVNPYYEFFEECVINCQRCVPTFEMRCRGRDVIVLPANYYDDFNPDSLSHYPFAVWENPEIIACKGNGREDIENHMEKWGDGARAEICVCWKNTDSGHVFVAEQVDGKTRYYDPQNGSTDVSHYFKQVELDSVQVCRIDNLDFSDRIKECCKEV